MILVAGSNGHVGREIIKKACAANMRVRCFDLTPPDITGIDPSCIEAVTGDITDAPAVQKALQGIDTVFFVIGLKRQGKSLTHEMVEHGGLKNIIEEGRKAGVHHIVYTSALGVGKGVPALSLAAKWNAEQSLIHSGIAYTIFRPSGYFVDFAEHFAPKIKQTGSFTLIGDGHYLLQPLDPVDLAEAFIKCAGNERVKNKIFKIAGPETFTLRQIVELVGRVVGREVKIKTIPFWIANGMFSCIAVLTGNRGGKDFLYRMSRDSICTEPEIREMREAFRIDFKRLEPWLFEQLGRQ